MRYTPYRRACQIGVFAIMFAIPLLNLFEIYWVTGTFYAVNIGKLGVADPVAVLQTVFASGDLVPPILLSVLFPLLLALLLGRVWCGWMCPYHLISDVAVASRNLYRTKLLGKDEPETLCVPAPFKANSVRYGFLILGVAASGMVGIPLLNYVSAPGIVSTEAMILVKDLTLSVEFVFIALIFLLELLLIPRFWCRLFCPTGALLGLLRAPFTMTVRSKVGSSKAACCKDEQCSAACPMGLAPYREGADSLCTNCARCIDACRQGTGRGNLRFEGFSK